MLLLALAIAPGLAIVVYMYYRESNNRRPKRYLLLPFVLGVLAIVPAIALQLLARNIFGDIQGVSSVAFYAFTTFCVVGISEEGSKLFMVWRYVFHKSVFDEPFDGIVYTVMVGMGFATAENIMYVQQHGPGVAILRMCLSVPAHAAFGVIMGYYVGLAKFTREKWVYYLAKGFILAVFFHGTFDFFLSLQDNVRIRKDIGEGWLLAGAIGSWALAVRLSFRAIRLHRERLRIETDGRDRREQQP